jgi:hypothetical protein
MKELPNFCLLVASASLVLVAGLLTEVRDRDVIFEHAPRKTITLGKVSVGRNIRFDWAMPSSRSQFSFASVTTFARRMTYRGQLMSLGSYQAAGVHRHV